MLTRHIESTRETASLWTWYYVKGPEGAVQFVLAVIDGEYKPIDLGYHSPKAMNEHQASNGLCSVIGKDCYYDGSMGAALSLYEEFKTTEDPEVIWQGMEEYYREVFK